MSQQDGTTKQVQQRLYRAAQALAETARTPKYLDAYHAEQKREPYFADVLLMATSGCVVSPASIAWTMRLILPGWIPDDQSEFGILDNVCEGWLVVHSRDPDEEMYWYEVERQHGFFLGLKDEAAWLALEQLHEEFTSRDPEPREWVTVEAVDLEQWIRVAPIADLLALADTQWGRDGVLPETREALSAFFRGPEGDVWRRPDEDGEALMVDTDPEQILRWLHRHRPYALAAVVLIRYTQEYYPADTCIQMDPWLYHAIQIVSPGRIETEADGHSMSDVARELLRQLPLDEEGPAARDPGNVTPIGTHKDNQR